MSERRSRRVIDHRLRALRGPITIILDPLDALGAAVAVLVNSDRPVQIVNAKGSVIAVLVEPDDLGTGWGLFGEAMKPASLRSSADRHEGRRRTFVELLTVDNEAELPDYVRAFDTQTREVIENSTKVGCFSCVRAFRRDSVKRWRWWKHGKVEEALCPFCKNADVIGDASGFRITVKLLRRMHSFWCYP